MVWKKITKYKYVSDYNEIILDKLDGIWSAIYYPNGNQEGGEIILSSKSLIELEQLLKAWIKKKQFIQEPYGLPFELTPKDTFRKPFDVHKETGVWS